MSVHSILKHNDNLYSVGLWLPNGNGGATFSKLLVVNNFRAAWYAANMLNGGDPDKLNRVFEHIVEEC